MKDVYARLKELGLTLPAASAPKGLYKLGVQYGNLFFTSGKGWTEGGKPPVAGKAGAEVSAEQAKECAKQSMLCLLANTEYAIGDLNRIRRVVRLTGYVASAPDFKGQTQVVNGASELLAALYGEDCGVGSRSAIGVAALPMDMPVEVEAIFELESE